MADDPQAPTERRTAARHLVQNPLVCLEHDPELFRLIRRHEGELDRWFTQRLGYRLHLDADTARLLKTGVVPANRPLRTASGRPFHQLEYVLLALVLASVASGPDVISLRDLVEQVRSAAVEADIALADDATERRAVVSVLTWMIERGLADELHARVGAYATDDDADAVLKLRPDRIALLPLPALVGASDPSELLANAERRSPSRTWMRARLVEDPVVYRSDLGDHEWSELRRRLGDEEQFLDEMFGLVLESRAEGVASVDPAGTLAERRFPTSGTIGHAALLVIDAVFRRAAPDPADGDGDGYGDGARADGDGKGADEGVAAGADNTGRALPVSPVVAMDELVGLVSELAGANASRWSNDLVGAPERLTRRVVELLVDLRLAELVPAPTRPPVSGSGVPAPTPPSVSDPERAPLHLGAESSDTEPPKPEATVATSSNPEPRDAATSPDPERSDPDAPVAATSSHTLGTRATGPIATSLRLLPGAARFLPAALAATSDPEVPQESLW